MAIIKIEEKKKDKLFVIINFRYLANDNFSDI